VDRTVANFERLWHRHHERVHAFALRRTDQATAQDVVAETFLVAWRRHDEVPREPTAWLLGVARHVLANQARGRRRREALTEVLINQALTYAPAPGEIDRELLTALARLPDRDRELLVLTSWDGLSLREAGQVLGLSAPAAGVGLFRARNRLRDLLRPAPAGSRLQPEEGQA